MAGLSHQGLGRLWDKPSVFPSRWRICFCLGPSGACPALQHSLHTQENTPMPRKCLLWAETVNVLQHTSPWSSCELCYRTGCNYSGNKLRDNLKTELCKSTAVRGQCQGSSHLSLVQLQDTLAWESHENSLIKLFLSVYVGGHWY